MSGREARVTSAGWYETAAGYGYWDGSRWMFAHPTDSSDDVPPAADAVETPSRLTTVLIGGAGITVTLTAVALGIAFLPR